MDSPVIISNTVQPVCLAAANTDPDQYAGQDAIVLGWGTAGITIITNCLSLNELKTI